jgi:hypothetical protein
MNSALASTGRTKPSSITPSVEKRSDELEYAFVDNPFRDARHQNVVIDSVEGRHDRLPISRIFRHRRQLPASGIRLKAARWPS